MKNNIAEVYEIKEDLKYHSFKMFPTFSLAIRYMNNLAKVKGLKFVSDQTLFGGYYVDEKTGACWGVR